MLDLDYFDFYVGTKSIVDSHIKASAVNRTIIYGLVLKGKDLKIYQQAFILFTYPLS